MKKLIYLLLSLTLVFALAACHQEATPTEPPVSTTSPDTTPDTQPSTTPVTEPVIEPTVYDLPMAAITVKNQVEFTENENGAPVFEYRFQDFWLQLPNSSMTDTVMLDLLNRIDETRTTAESIQKDALAANPAYPYSLTIHYEPRRIDGCVLSLSGLLSSYSGGSHAENSCMGLTYDLATGNVLTLADVLTADCTADTICRLTVDALAEIAEAQYLYEDYSAIAEERFGEKFLEDSGWYLSSSGLCFDFAPYEIAPYASGVVTAVIPYAQLVGVLEDAWFPAEQIFAISSLHIEPFTSETSGGFRSFTEVILSDEGTTCILYTDGLLYDLTIELGHLSGDGTFYTHESTVFAAGTLCPLDAIVLQTDDLSTIRITYTANGETVQMLPGEINR